MMTQQEFDRWCDGLNGSPAYVGEPDLEHNAPTVKQCSTMVKAILAGEKQFRESKEELDELRINLGLKPLDLQVDIGVSSTQSTTSAEPASSTTQSTKQRQPIGQPKPQRLPIGDTIDAA